MMTGLQAGATDRPGRRFRVSGWAAVLLLFACFVIPAAGLPDPAWARHLADRADRDAGVERRRVELLVSEQSLDDTDIGLLLQEVGGKAVPQRMNADTLGDAGTPRGQANDPMQLAPWDWPASTAWYLNRNKSQVRQPRKLS